MSKTQRYLVQLFADADVDFRTDIRFADVTTLRVGGAVKLAVYPRDKTQLVFCVQTLRRLAERFAVVGNGSNILASDNYFDGVAVITKMVNELSVDGDIVVADCGVTTGRLFAFLRKRGLGCGEFLACIPSTVGGAVRGNAGCFGCDVGSVVESVTALTDIGVVTFGKRECSFSKRNSLFKRDKLLVLSAKMKFVPSDVDAVTRRFSQMYAQKRATQPLGALSAGCMLYHPDFSLAPYLQKAGLKGMRVGGAEVSKKHVGFVLNIDKAAAKDIYYILLYQKKMLADKYGIQAQTEVELIGFDGGNDDV